MGCDIHAYVEYSTFDNHQTGEPYWECLISNAGSRDYAMFSVLAGVRFGGYRLYEPRGLPAGELSYEAQRAAYLVIKDEYAEDEGYCSEENAQRWGGEILEKNGIRRTPGPDWHSHSWLTCDELAKALGHYMFTVTDRVYDIEWDAILAAMRALEERGAKTRLVFWFDN